jgi:hypothetical protein
VLAALDVLADPLVVLEVAAPAVLRCRVVVSDGARYALVVPPCTLGRKESTYTNVTLH